MSPSTQKNSAGLTALVVDDEQLIRWSLVETLEQEGHRVIEAGSAAEALRTLERSAPPDVVLLDYRLPDSNDLTLLEAIRRRWPAIQVILMTAYGTPDVVSGALALGAYRVVSKPFEMHDLAALVVEARASRR